MPGQLHEARSAEHSPDDDFLQSLQALLPSPEHFTRGLLKRLLKRHVPIWWAYFEHAAKGKLTMNHRVVLKIVKDGLTLRFVIPNSLGQTAAPDFAKE